MYAIAMHEGESKHYMPSYSASICDEVFIMYMGPWGGCARVCCLGSHSPVGDGTSRLMHGGGITTVG